MGKLRSILEQRPVIPEPYAIVQALPACRICGSAHPLARTPKIQSTNCPDCGEPVESGEPVLVKAAIGGVVGLAFTVLVGVGKGLLAIGRMVQPKRKYP